MEISTERLILKPLGTEYLESVHKYASDIENTKYMIHLPNETVDETKEFLVGCEREWAKQIPDFYEFAVIKESVHIGAVSIYLNENHDTAILGWILDPDYHNCGYATEAASAIVRFAEEKLSIRHFTAFCDFENRASENVMRKLGFTKTGCYDGRKNRISDEERKELVYELFA